MQIIEQTGNIDMRHTMYPSTAHLLEGNETFSQPAWSTCYGIVLYGSAELHNNKTVESLEYFCITNPSQEIKTIKTQGKIAIFTRLGFIGQSSVGGPVESTGRLSYIDGCSDSLLIYPPRLGDPSLNLLVFPDNIDQTFHIHPSIRLGVVIQGSGISSLKTKDLELKSGSVFCLDPQEVHRFQTQGSTMSIVIYHPDGSWGPTDHDHVMFNRTYIDK